MNNEYDALILIAFLLSPGLLLCGVFGMIVAGFLLRAGKFPRVLRGPWTGRLVGFLIGAIVGIFLSVLVFTYG